MAGDKGGPPGQGVVIDLRLPEPRPVSVRFFLFTDFYGINFFAIFADGLLSIYGFHIAICEARSLARLPSRLLCAKAPSDGSVWSDTGTGRSRRVKAPLTWGCECTHLLLGRWHRPDSPLGVLTLPIAPF